MKLSLDCELSYFDDEVAHRLDEILALAPGKILDRALSIDRFGGGGQAAQQHAALLGAELYYRHRGALSFAKLMPPSARESDTPWR